MIAELRNAAGVQLELCSKSATTGSRASRLSALYGTWLMILAAVCASGALRQKIGRVVAPHAIARQPQTAITIRTGSTGVIF